MSTTTLKLVALGAACLTLGTLLGAARPWECLTSESAADVAQEAKPKAQGEEAWRAARPEDPAVSLLREQLLAARRRLSDAKLAEARRAVEEDLEGAKDEEARKKAIDKFMRRVRDEVLGGEGPGLFHTP